jgi:hypothetical protein
MKTVRSISPSLINNLKVLAELAEWLGPQASLWLSPQASLEYLKEFVDQNYQGLHTSLGEYAYATTQEEGWDIPSHLASYIDYDSMGRDRELGGDIFTIESPEGLHIFNAR